MTIRSFLLTLAAATLAFASRQDVLYAQDRESAHLPPPSRGLFVTMTPDSLAARSSSGGQVDHAVSLKNPELAGALSVLVPGLGQVYNGETLKGAVVFAGFLGGIAVCIAAHIGDTNDSIGAEGWLGVAMVGTSYLWGVIDAPISAHRINREFPAPLLMELPAGGRTIAFAAGATRDGFALRVSLGL